MYSDIMDNKYLIQRLNKIFKGTDLDAILIYNQDYPLIDSNFFYLTDFTSGLFESSFLIAFRDHIEVATGSLEYENAILEANSSMEINEIHDVKSIQKFLKTNLKGLKVGYNEKLMPTYYYKLFKRDSYAKGYYGASKYLYNARAIKDELEINRIKNAVKITKKSLAEIQDYFNLGITEKELAAQFNYLQMKNGADRNSFDSIVSFDKNTALPHHSPDATKLRANSVVLLDVGAKVKNYCSDITRTFFYKPDLKSKKYKRLKDIYDTVSYAQQLGLKNIYSEQNGKNVYNKVNEFINKSNNGIYNGKFIHSLGHMIGIDVHDADPTALSNVDLTLKNNMIMSDEPGIYINGFGGVRIEDDVVIQNGKGKFL